MNNWFIIEYALLINDLALFYIIYTNDIIFAFISTISPYVSRFYNMLTLFYPTRPYLYLNLRSLTLFIIFFPKQL